MNKEIERKFLLDFKNQPGQLAKLITGLSNVGTLISKKTIEQAYLSFSTIGDPIERRIRRQGDKFYYAEKQNVDESLMSRYEIEKVISKIEYEKYITKKQGNIIKKVRYQFLIDGNIAEIDIYQGELKGLVIAEVEFSTLEKAKSFDSSFWNGKEVTENINYRNANLAKYGLKENKTYEIVLTGGPCGGKSTFISSCKRNLEAKGFKVIVVPEVATEEMEKGVSPADIQEKFQEIVMNKGLHNELNANLAAKAYNAIGKDVIIMYDRGISDGKAYCSTHYWQTLLKAKGFTEAALLKRYDAVFNIVTTAYGAEEAWKKQVSNNPNRLEKEVAEGRAAEDKTQQAWAGHHNFLIFDNADGWEAKVNKLFNAIYSLIGDKPVIRREKRLLVDMSAINMDDFKKHFSCTEVQITQTYLKSNAQNSERRVRKIGKDQEWAYYYTEKDNYGHDRVVREKIIKNKEEYLLLLEQADPNKSPIIKTRNTFMYKNQHLVLDSYKHNTQPLLNDKAILELKGIGKNQEFVLPNGVNVVQDVTDNREFSNSALASQNVSLIK